MVHDMQVSRPFRSIKTRKLTKNREKTNLKGGKRSVFFTGGNSTCWAHIRCHYDIYKQRCDEKDIPVNHHAIPRQVLRAIEEEKLNGGKAQVKIYQVLEKTAGPWEFSREDVLHAVVQFVACDDQVWLEVLKYLLYWWMVKSLAVAGKDLFRNCLSAMRPKAVKRDMPSTHDVTTYIHNQFVNWLKELKSDISVSFINDCITGITYSMR